MHLSSICFWCFLISPWIPVDSGFFCFLIVVAASDHLKLLYFFGGLVWPPSKLLFVSNAFLFEDGVCPSLLCFGGLVWPPSKLLFILFSRALCMKMGCVHLLVCFGGLVWPLV